MVSWCRCRCIGEQNAFFHPGQCWGAGCCYLLITRWSIVTVQVVLGLNDLGDAAEGCVTMTLYWLFDTVITFQLVWSISAFLKWILGVSKGIVKSRCLSLLYQVFIPVLLMSVCMWILFIKQDGDIIVWCTVCVSCITVFLHLFV